MFVKKDPKWVLYMACYKNLHYDPFCTYPVHTPHESEKRYRLFFYSVSPIKVNAAQFLGLRWVFIVVNIACLNACALSIFFFCQLR